MDRVTTRPRRSGDGDIVDEIFAAMKGTPAKVVYDQALGALTDHLRTDGVGFERLSDYESAVIARVELAIRLARQTPLPPHAFGGPEVTTSEEEFDRCWKLVRAMLGVDHLREVNDLRAAANARASEAYESGIRRGIGQLTNSYLPPETNTGEILGELARATATIARHLEDLEDRV